MIIVQSTANDSVYRDIEDAKSDFATWDCGDWDEVMYNNGSDFRYFDIDQDELSAFNDDVMHMVFDENDEIKLIGTWNELEQHLAQLMAHLNEFNDIYDEAAESFSDDKFRAYMALVEAEQKSNPNLRRKNINGYQQHNYRKFIFNAEGTHGEHVELEPNDISAMQFEKMGIKHPCRAEIKKHIEARYASYAQPLTQERYENGAAISKLKRQIVTLEAELRQAKELLADKEAQQAQLIEREQHNIEYYKENLSTKLKELGL